MHKFLLFYRIIGIFLYIDNDMGKLTKLDKAFETIKGYNGKNPYILDIKHKLYNYKSYNLSDFDCDYVLSNYDKAPKPINKVVSMADWWCEKYIKEWNLDFEMNKIKIISYLGETKDNYHCIIQYRKSVNPFMFFLNKNAVINNFLVDDYNNTIIDFDRYDNLSSAKDPNRRLFEHQKDAVKFLINRKKCILADGMGLGKSTELAVAAIEGNFDVVLIICPASLKTNWKKELMWYINENDITIIDSFNDKTKPELERFLGYKEGKSNLSRAELLEEAKTNGKWKDNHYVIINYDILDEFYEKPKGRTKTAINEALANSPLLSYILNKKSLIIIDEAHVLSNSTSIRYKVIEDLVKKGNPNSIYLATGTPVTNDPQNLFCMLKFLGEPITSDREYYMKRYCGATKICHPKDRDKRNAISHNFIQTKGKRNWYDLTDKEKDELNQKIERSCRMMTIAKDATNLEELKQRISHIYLRRLKEDESICTVTKTIHEMFYELTETQKLEYNRLWDEYEAEKAKEEPEKEIKKDLLEGAIYRKYLSNEMVKNTENVVDKLLKRGEKVIIACCFDEELYTLKDYYSEKCVIYNGKMSLKQKDKAIEEFYNNDNVMVFIGNINAAGVGINLINARYLIFNDMSYVPGLNQQMEDRIYRVTQKRDCHIVYQIFKDTQYEHMWNTILKKSNVIDQIIKKESEK